MKTKILLFAAILFISINSLAQKNDKILLNKTYRVKVVEDYGTPDSSTWKDEMIFKKNKLYFTTFSKNWDFPYAPCTVSDSNDIITFTCEVKNVEGDDRKLSGTITGKVIEGTVVIARNDGVARPYLFSGKLK